MSITYSIDNVAGVVQVVGKGVLRMPEMIGLVDRIAEDSMFAARNTVIFDLREADYNAELNDGDDFVAALRRRQADFLGPFALLVNESLHFLGRLYSVLASVSGFDRMRCFTDEDEARAWCRAFALSAATESGIDT